MVDDTRRRKNASEGLVEPSDVRRVWEKVKGNLTKQELATILTLRNRSTLTRLMNGPKNNPFIRISRKFSRALREFETGQRGATVIASMFIPEGTILPDNAEIFVCKGCGKKAIRMNKRRLFHSTNCQQRTWYRNQAKG